MFTETQSLVYLLWVFILPLFNMKILKDFVFVQEIGFPPSTIELLSGLQSTWSFSKELRTHTKLRLGVIKNIGTHTSNVKVGQHVLYTSLVAVPKDVTGQKDHYLIAEENLAGYYTNLIFNQDNTIDMSKVNFTPLGDRVLIEREDTKEKEDQTTGLILGAAGAAKEKPNTGKIVRVGEAIQSSKVTVVKEGDEVMFGRNAGLEIHLPEGTFLLMREGDIFGVL